MQDKRQQTRFKPDPGSFAQLDSSAEPSEFKPDRLALILSESYGGVGLVSICHPDLVPGSICTVKTGTLDPIRAEIRWRVDLDGQVMKVGLKYLS